MGRRDKFWSVVFRFAFWSDWIVAGAYLFFIFYILAYMGFGYEDLVTIGDWTRWTWAQLFFAIYFIPMVIYIIFFPWSFFKKRKEIFFSELSHPFNYIIVIFIVLAIHTNAFSFLLHPSIHTEAGYVAYDFLLMIVSLFILITYIFVWVGGFLGYANGAFWYRKFGIEPMTWEEAMRRYGEE